jgi:2-methylcitrate dehydratase PrpD
LEAGWPLVCEPGNRKYAPTNIVDAQFSMPFGAAVALTWRDAGLDRFTEANVQSQQVRSLMGKVVLMRDIRLEQNYPQEWPAVVKVSLTNGKDFEQRVRFPKGDPENPLSWEELGAKFRSLAERALPKSRCEQIHQAVVDLNASSRLQGIWKLAALDRGAASRAAR